MGVHEKLSTVVSTRGQVVLPKAVRDILNWKPGTRLAVEQTRDGVTLKAEPYFKPTKLEDVIGFLRHDGPPLSLEDMDAAVAREAKRRARKWNRRAGD